MKFSRLLIILFFTIIFFVNVAASENLNSTDFNLTSDNTIFVNSSYVGWFEDGSQAHPYKSVSNGVNAISKHSSKSNLCIAEGEYKISKALTFRNNVNIIGSGDNVILNAKGLSTVFKFYQGTYSISNIKITNANAMISHSSSDGAAIFINSSYVSNRWVSLDVFSLIIRNCVFENNSGYNGGAIYAGNGNLTIINSSFISNKGVYGGALYVEGCNVLIDNVNFYNNSASKDGGGVYTNNSYLTVSNSKINYNMAVNGAGAYLSFGVMNLSNLTFIGNTANGSSSNGGGLYLYESCGNINNSYFYRNKVLGDIISSSAIFNVNSLGLNIFNTIISNNYLKGKYGFGSVISNKGLLSISNSSIINNEMFVSNDIDDLIYNPNGILTFNDNIVKDNYFSLGNNSNTFYAIFDAYLTGNIYDDINIIIPKTYDLRNITLTNGSNVSWVTSVKDQGSYGTCWAFAALDALESNILMNTGEYYNFSVSNLVNIMGKYGDEGYDFDGRYGGSYYLSSAYLTRWDGPVNESDNPYKPYSKYSPNNLTTIKHVQDILFIPLRQNISDLDAIKIAILKYGALAVIYRSTSSNYVSSDYNPNIYEPLPGEANHAVVLVGWDDNYSASNFNSRYGQPIGNGAFIIKNSWGSNVGDDGYYYISYYDLSLASCGGYGFTGMAYNNVENIDNYKNIYEYDPLGNTIAFMGFNNESAWFSNVFTSISDNPLQAFTIITPSANSNYEVKVYVNNELKFDGNGIIVEPGYHTIKLDKYVPLDIGDVFKIVVKLTTPNFYYPIAIETNISGMSSKATAQSGQSYISKDGNNWYGYCSNNPILFVDSYGLYRIASNDNHGFDSYEEYQNFCEQEDIDFENEVMNNTLPNRAINIVDTGSTINIYAYVNIGKSSLSKENIVDDIMADSNITYREAVLNGIREGWTGNYTDKKGVTRAVVAYIVDLGDGKKHIARKNQKTIPFTLSPLSEATKYHKKKEPAHAWTKWPNYNTGINCGYYNSVEALKWVSAHEFGHSLGLKDVYLLKKQYYSIMRYEYEDGVNGHALQVDYAMVIENRTYLQSQPSYHSDNIVKKYATMCN